MAKGATVDVPVHWAQNLTLFTRYIDSIIEVPELQDVQGPKSSAQTNAPNWFIFQMETPLEDSRDKQLFVGP